MMSSLVLQVIWLALLAPLLHAEYEYENHLVITPQSPLVQIGTNFTATCVIINTAEVTADDLYWNLSASVVPKEYYRKINTSALAVTIPITGENSEWLFCHARQHSASYVILNKSKFTHGIWLTKGYFPSAPENLSCIAEQQETFISESLTCKWDVAGRQTKNVKTEYMLMVDVIIDRLYNKTTKNNTASVNLSTFPNHMELKIWVVAHNLLGTVESEPLRQDSNYFVKTNPPSNVEVLAENVFPSSLLISWKHPVDPTVLKLTYEIRYCQNGLQSCGTESVPRANSHNLMTSLRLQNLQPHTEYVIQMRCKKQGDGGYWSDWTDNVTVMTPEHRPTSKPDLWKVPGSEMGEVLVVAKDPKFSNGRITAFGLKIQYSRKGSVEQEIIPVNGSGAEQSYNDTGVTLLRRISLAHKQFVHVCVNASNSVGTSPEACLGIPAKPSGGVEGLRAWTQDEQMFVEWKPPNSSVTEYVIEWSRPGRTDWQRENRSTSKAVIKGRLEPWVRYNVSLYVLRSGMITRKAGLQAYLHQAAPSQAPSIIKSNPGYEYVDLTWDQIPLDMRRGFLTNYTIYCKKEKQFLEPIHVPANVTSYTLTKLSGNTKYDVWISASTAAGSLNGTHHSFTTVKHAPGMVEGIVVGVSLGFLFLLLMAILLCFYKKDVIKENLWPQIPNPGESTIGSWSPDYPLKAETPKENCVSGVCVLDVGVCEVKLGFEDDKSSLSLKKDKYLSEEHSSGIGGSSCMSSPRQSVSDSDEGPDLADSTASTVQYSSVVASSGYKGQTPGTQSQHSVFSRSESTQPLLDSEEHPDVLLQVQHGRSDDVRLLGGDFCPLREDTEPDGPSADPDSATAAVSSYMPQLAGYRPQ